MNLLARSKFIDARDLAAWMTTLVEEGTRGLFNATGPADPINMGDLIEAVSKLFNSRREIVWVPSDWLSARGVRGDDAPFFWCRSLKDAVLGELWLSYEVSSAKAVEQGMRLRSPHETLADNLSWYMSLPQERQHKPRTGWSAEMERELLNEFRASSS